ncbi:unnamed protein product [Sphagnum tenellum]
MIQDEGISEGPIVWKTVGVLTTTGGRTDVVLEFPTEMETINMGKMAIWRLSFGNASWISDYIVNYRDQHNAFDGGEGEVLNVDFINDRDCTTERVFGTGEKMNQKVKEAIQTILNEVNGGNTKDVAASIYEAISQDHRTLQQQFWSAMLFAQMRYASNPHDMRNEYAVKLAKLVKQLAIDNNLDYGLPYI